MIPAALVVTILVGLLVFQGAYLRGQIRRLQDADSTFDRELLEIRQQVDEHDDRLRGVNHDHEVLRTTLTNHRELMARVAEDLNRKRRKAKGDAMT